MERKFETKIKRIRYGVFKEIVNRAYADNLNDNYDLYMNVPKIIIPGPKANLRCCIYKERAIVQERIKLAMGGDKNNPNNIEIIDIACDECPVDGMYVLQTCRSCISHDCKHACPREAITIIDKKAVIDQSKCIECGKCAKACPYGAIIEQRRPCVFACKENAINIDINKKAVIDNNRCTECGICINRCPFGAISDKSMILDVVSILKNKKNYNVYAIYAPAIEGQFDAKIGQIATGLKKLGFDYVKEVAMGADITLKNEAEEFNEKGILISSCCPSFVKYVKINFPELTKYISDTDSPMKETAKIIREQDKNCKIVFIGPCAAKKKECQESNHIIDAVISFEELQAFFDAREIDIEQLEESICTEASDDGKSFAKSGGLTSGIIKYAKIPVDAISMCDIEEMKKELIKLKFNKTTKNFFEGMACDGGCINGALTLWHKGYRKQNNNA